MSTTDPEKGEASDPGRGEKETGLMKDAADVGKAAALVYAGVTLVLLGSQAAVIQLVTKPGELSDEAVSFYLDVFKQSAPFTLGIAAVGILWAWWLRTTGPISTGSFVRMLGASALILVVARVIGRALGVGLPVNDENIVGGTWGVFGGLINTFHSYYLAYKRVLFFSSLATGGLLTYIWVWKVEPRIKAWRNARAKAASPAPTNQPPA